LKHRSNAIDVEQIADYGLGTQSPQFPGPGGVLANQGAHIKPAIF
jgi:hypothetical protein